MYLIDILYLTFKGIYLDDENKIYIQKRHISLQLTNTWVNKGDQQ